MTTIFIVRHGQTVWNTQGRVQGQKDSPLTELGIQQAKNLAKEFKDIHFDHIFSSDLLRAKRTAEIIALEKKLAIQATIVLREQSYGKYEGIQREEFYKLFVKWDQLSDAQRHTHVVGDDMESNETAVGRLITFIRETALAYPDNTVLIVTHGALMRYFYIHLGYGTYTSFRGFENLGYIKIETDGVDFFLKEAKGIK